MLHIVRLIEHRHPDAADRIVAGLGALAATAVLLGVGILLLG